MIYKIVYIVTHYGCNSTPSDMIIPKTKLFNNYQRAYKYFESCSPRLDDKYNKATAYVNKEDDFHDKEYIVIENRVQTAGYHDGETGIYAKRPYGAVIAKAYYDKEAV